MSTILFIFEILGTLVFAASGALLGVRKNMDLFGVIILACVTAAGGGVIRDVVIGCTPPAVFVNPLYIIIAIFTSLLLFIPVVRRFVNTHQACNFAFLIFDAIGLGIFTAIGVKNTCALGLDGMFLHAFVGVITGVGGGMLRDILAGEMPFVLRRDIYASASVAGAVLCSVMLRFAPDIWAVVSCAVLVVIIRLVSVYYNLNLPKINDE